MSEDKAIYQTLDLEAIEALAKAATPGPWVTTYGLEEFTPDILRAWSEGQIMSGSFAESDRILNQVEHDAIFIAHAREDVPALVTEVRRLRAALAVFADRDNWREVPEWGPNGLGGYNYIVHVWQKSDFSPPWVKAWEILGSELTKKGGQE